MPMVDPSRPHWLILDVGVRRPNHRWVWPSWVALAPDDLARLTRLLQYNENPVWTADEVSFATSIFFRARILHQAL